MARGIVRGSNAPSTAESYAVGDKIIEDLFELMRTKYNIVGGQSLEYNYRPEWEDAVKNVREHLRELVHIHDCSNW